MWGSWTVVWHSQPFLPYKSYMMGGVAMPDYLDSGVAWNTCDIKHSFEVTNGYPGRVTYSQKY